jgi:hypothetical protein
MNTNLSIFYVDVAQKKLCDRKDGKNYYYHECDVMCENCLNVVRAKKRF